MEEDTNDISIRFVLEIYIKGKRRKKEKEKKKKRITKSSG